MNEVVQRAFIVALLVAMVLLIGYQVFMLWWTRKMVGKIPGTIRVLRGINIVILVVGTILIVSRLAGW